MRKLNRLPLSPETLTFIAERTQQVLQAPDPRAEAQRLWGLQDNKALKEIRAKLEAMASGLQRCMYCEDSEGTDLEHFWPKALYPGRAFLWLNLLLACSRCNSNFKREQFPLDTSGAPLLIDPTVDEPREHLHLSPTTGKFTHRTPKGEESIQVFGLDRDLLEKGRQDAWRVLQVLLVEYDTARSGEDALYAEELKTTICRHPFASVFVWLLECASHPQASRLVKSPCLAVLRKYPDLKGWL